MAHYQRYTTSIKHCFALGVEKILVEKEILDKIPSSTSTHWKSMETKDIIGFESDKNLQKDLADIDILYHPAMYVPRKMTVACGKFVQLLVQSLGKQQVRKAVRNNKEIFINFLDEFSELINYQNFAEILNLSTKTIYNWKQQVKFKCESSAFFQCVKRNTNQATLNEVRTIKEWLVKPEYEFWGIHSIWAKAFQAGETHLAKQTWYRYNKILGFRKQTKKGQNPKNSKPLRTEKVNQIWHADITIFKPLNGVKYYIYTVMDNYSRYIHSWRIEKVVSAKIRLETIQEAINNAFGGKPFSNLQLVTDGGPENDNLTIKTFMNENRASIHHSIALRDIVQSNSMMEAFYKITKYVSLYKQKIENYEELCLAFKKWIEEYHHEKPHYSLGVFTPNQILQGANKNESFTQRMIDAAKARRAFNQKANCSQKCQE